MMQPEHPDVTPQVVAEDKIHAAVGELPDARNVRGAHQAVDDLSGPSICLFVIRKELRDEHRTRVDRCFPVHTGVARVGPFKVVEAFVGYSKWAPKSKIGLGQGEKGSPEKYCIVIDPLLEYLAHFRDSGLEIGPDQHIDIPGGMPIIMNDRLVAVLFCDDMFLVSGSAEGLQQLLYKAGEVYDFAGARQVAYKSFSTLESLSTLVES